MNETFKPAPATPPPLKTAPPIEVTKKVVPQEPSKKIVAEAARPVPPALPAARPAPLVEVAKEVPREPIKPVVPQTPVPPTPLRPAPPVEVVKEVSPEASKTVIPEAPRPVPPMPPVEAVKQVPPEPIKTTIPEIAKPVSPPPAVRPAPPVEVAKVVPQEPSKTTAPPPPSGPPSDGEVRQFLGRYVSSYNNQSTEGLISFFSPRAIQNKKDTLEKIRKTYDSFFDQMEAVQYRITINEIKPQQNSVEVRGQYQLDGVLMNTRKKVNWKGQIRWVLVREDGDLRIVSLDYQPQK